jgi:hypothetical protein
MRTRRLSFLLRHHLADFTNDNLHRIAISNLQDGHRDLERWWANKYSIPLKAFDEHTLEELLVEKFEDYYKQNPDEISRFEALAEQTKDEDWDGSTSTEHERGIAKWLSKKKKVDLTKYQSEEQLTEEEEKKILGSLGFNLPKSSRIVNLNGDGKGEFEDDFLGGGNE